MPGRARLRHTTDDSGTERALHRRGPEGSTAGERRGGLAEDLHGCGNGEGGGGEVVVVRERGQSMLGSRSGCSAELLPGCHWRGASRVGGRRVAASGCNPILDHHYLQYLMLLLPYYLFSILSWSCLFLGDEEARISPRR